VPRSFEHNEEGNVCFHLATLVAQMEQAFRNGLQVRARVRLSEWQKRGLLARSQEPLAAFFQEQV
jgi:phosphatidylserine/phosphatidylglycerophosphate/cardiolipin synthase-like enzyme